MCCSSSLAVPEFIQVESPTPRVNAEAAFVALPPGDGLPQCQETDHKNVKCAVTSYEVPF